MKTLVLAALLAFAAPLAASAQTASVEIRIGTPAYHYRPHYRHGHRVYVRHYRPYARYYRQPVVIVSPRPAALPFR